MTKNIINCASLRRKSYNMSKKIELIIEISDNGKMIVTTKGTEGTECLDVMSFLDKIKSFEVTETTHNADMQKRGNPSQVHNTDNI